MTTQNKLFSWLGFGKKSQNEQPAPAEQELPAVAQPEQASSKEHAAEETTVAADVPTEQPVVAAKETLEEAAVTAPMESAVETEILPTPAAELDTPVQPEVGAKPAVIEATTAKVGFFTRLRQGLSKTSENLGNGLASLFRGKKIDDELYEELETQLLLADVGVETSQKLIKQLVLHADRKQLRDAEALYDKLQQEMADMLQKVEQPLQLDGADGPYVILMVGVNGVGKTTTIGKLAQQFKQQGKTVMLAAGDTFRAAAVEQLQVWGERNQIPVIAQQTGADSASVIFDAYQAAKARNVDVLIADTAGRLQNKTHLMEELKKIVRVMKKIDGAAPHEVMLTLDAGTGQNALSQARLFKEAVDITGISLTKLDGTAKGGVIFAIADQFSLPIRYIGVGEGIDDLRVFHSHDFIKALFNRDL
ncbi:MULTISPECIES: signal recognition particle-docking protein FtsY [Rheinheimera]|uniref:Signal recognition particle receptor FtsY n=1 Tax=Rheinheimera marina TaxID=1774958 RepID=A0ABV9JME6_9GAMM